MVGFTDPIVADQTGPRIWEVLEPCRYMASTLEQIIIPQGFETDLASVPRALWWLYPPFGRYTDAAILHDYLYATRWRNSRADCDREFLVAMLVTGVPVGRCLKFYLAVRAFGGLNW